MNNLDINPKLDSYADTQTLKFSDLNSKIDDYLDQNGIYENILNEISQFYNSNQIQTKAGIEQLLFDTMKEPGIINELLRYNYTNKSISNLASGYVDNTLPLPPKSNQYYLSINLVDGRAFEPGLFYDSYVELSTLVITCHMMFKGIRARGKTFPFSTEVDFNDFFIFPLQDLDSNTLSSSNKLLTINEPIYIVFIISDTTSKVPNKVFASEKLEWRNILVTGSLSFTFELAGTDQIGQLSGAVGIINLKIDLLPSVLQDPIEEHIVNNKISHDKTILYENEKKFYQYTQHWYKNYIAINPQFENRNIPLFLFNEYNRKQFITTYLYPIYSYSCIESSYSASRFVSSFPLNESYDKLGKDTTKCTCSSFTTLCMKTGNHLQHSILLCSLLLGFKLESYIAYGTILLENKVLKEYSWVVLFLDTEIYFWDPITGQKYKFEQLTDLSMQTKYNYFRLDCLFNDKSFYANRQYKNDVKLMCFDIHNAQYWYSMDKDMINTLRPAPKVLLLNSTIDTNELSNKIERELFILFRNFREKLNLPLLELNEDLSIILSQSLASYEYDKMTHKTFGNLEFKSCISKYIPNGMVFQGFPISFNYSNTNKIMDSLIKKDVFKDMLSVRGSNYSLGLRVKIYSICEDIISLWLIVGIQYYP